MSRNKHSPCRLETYFENFDARLQEFLRRGFALSEDLSFVAMPGYILLSGKVYCLGDIVVKVWEQLSFVGSALVQRSSYSYNVSVRGKGSVFRYDSPHDDHHFEHHHHQYDYFGASSGSEVTFIYNEEDIPILHEVLEKASEWFYDNYIRLVKGLKD